MELMKDKYVIPSLEVLSLTTYSETLGKNSSNGEGEDLGTPSTPGVDWGSLFG